MAGSMPTGGTERAPPAQATQVVMVRGTLLPMPQADALEDLPSPTVTPESATLMRLANNLARQQPSGARTFMPPCLARELIFHTCPLWSAIVPHGANSKLQSLGPICCCPL